MKRWEQIENYLTQMVAQGQAFNAPALANDLGVPAWEASAMIQSYLAAQRGTKSKTLYVLYRTGRTRNALWHVGSRTLDVRNLGKQHLDDMKIRIFRALEPDLIRMGILNPRATQVADALAKAVEANLALLAAGLP